jgi:hypothetical protein
MEEVDRVLEALSVVERYDEYLFRRTWGKALIVIGVALPLGVFVGMNSAVVAAATGLDVQLVAMLANLFSVLLCFGYIAQAFYGAWKPTKKEGESKHGASYHGWVIAFLWFAAFSIASMAPESLQIIALLWAASVSCMLSFAVLRATGGHGQAIIILYLGILLAVVSLPLLLITDPVLAAYAALTAFSLCFIAAGLVMLKLAGESLRPAPGAPS